MENVMNIKLGEENIVVYPNKQEKIKAILDALHTYAGDKVPEALYFFLEDEISLLEKRSQKAKEKRDEKNAENEILDEKIISTLNKETYISVNEVQNVLDDMNLTSQKIIARLTQLVNKNKVEKQQITIPATETTKARKAMGYKLK